MVIFKITAVRTSNAAQKLFFLKSENTRICSNLKGKSICVRNPTQRSIAAEKPTSIPDPFAPFRGK
jgi:hypothetical protein